MNIRKNFIYNSILSVSQIILPIITFPYVTRILLPKSLGDVNFMDNIVQYFCTIAALGIPLYGTREIAKLTNNKVRLNKVFSELLTLHFLVSLFCVIVFFCCLLWFDKLHDNFVLGLVGIGIIFSNVFTINWFFSGLEKFAYTTKVNLIIRVISILAIFLLIKSPADKNLYYGLTLISNLLIAGINILYSSKFVQFQIKKLDLKIHLKYLFLFFSLSIITNVYVLLDSVILGFLKNTIEVGYYTVALRISKLPISLIASLTTVVIPLLSRSTGKKEEMTAMINKTMQFTLIICIPIAMGIFCLSSELVSVFAGEHFDSSLTSLRILSFIVVPIGVALVSYQVLIPMNKEKLIMYTAFAGVIISLILNFTLIPTLNNVGSAIASLSTEISVALILVFFSKKIIDYKIPWRTFFEGISLTLPFFLIRELALHYFSNLITVIIITVFFSILIYFIGFAVLFKNEFIRENISIVRNYCKKHIDF